MKRLLPTSLCRALIGRNKLLSRCDLKASPSSEVFHGAQAMAHANNRNIDRAKDVITRC